MKADHIFQLRRKICIYDCLKFRAEWDSNSWPLRLRCNALTTELLSQLVTLWFQQIDSMLPCVCSVIDHRWRQNVVRTKKWHTSVSLTFFFWRPLWSIYWIDARQHGIYLFYTIKKQTTTAFLFHNSKADLCPLRRTRKKPFDVICCQNENEAISLVAMRI